jgi:hypothetical protein
LYQNILFLNLIAWIGVFIPLKVADGMFVMHLRHRWPDAWESLGSPGYFVSAKTTQMIRGFVRHGNHPILDDKYIHRLTVVQKILAPLQSILFFSFIVFFVLMIINR